MYVETINLNPDMIQKISLLHDDMRAILSTIAADKITGSKLREHLKKAGKMLDEVDLIFSYHVDTGTSYQESLHQLMLYLEKIDIGDQVLELFNERQSARFEIMLKNAVNSWGRQKCPEEFGDAQNNFLEKS